MKSEDVIFIVFAAAMALGTFFTLWYVTKEKVK